MDPRSSPTKTKSIRKESSFPAGMPLIKSVGADNRQSRRFVALYHRNTKITIRSEERDNWQNKALRRFFTPNLIFSATVTQLYFFSQLSHQSIQLFHPQYPHANSLENLLKLSSKHFPLVTISLILKTSSHDYTLTLLGENWCWSLHSISFLFFFLLFKTFITLITKN